MAITAALVREREVEDAIIVDADGRVLHNALQQDAPVIVRDYSDGMRHLINKKTGKLIVDPFDPQEARVVTCPHCHGELGGYPGEGGG